MACMQSHYLRRITSFLRQRSIEQGYSLLRRDHCTFAQTLISLLIVYCVIDHCDTSGKEMKYIHSYVIAWGFQLWQYLSNINNITSSYSYQGGYIAG